MYHPANIDELKPPGYDMAAHTEEIRKQKNDRYHYILPIIVSSRQSYEEFKTNDKLRDANTDSIVDDFKSDEFERFYKFFDMKAQFNKTYLSPFNLKKESLVKTKWFKTQIQNIINS